MPFALTCRVTGPVAPHPVDDPAPPSGLGRGDRLLHADVFAGLESVPQPRPVGRVYAWGPASGDWSGLGRWVTRWRAPGMSAAGWVSSAVVAAPFRDAEGARGELGLGRSGLASFTLTTSDDAAHGLLFVRRPGRTSELDTLDEGSTQAPVRRADGATWGLVDAALRVGASWFIAVPQSPRRATLELFRIDAGLARRIAIVRHLLGGPGVGPARLARGSGPDALGLILDGEAAPEGSIPRRWVIPVDVDSGALDAPLPLGAIDLSDRGEVGPCDEGGEAGWVIDVPWANVNVSIALGALSPSVHLRDVSARLRLASDRACVERIVGEATLEDAARVRAHELRPLALPSEATLPVTLLVNGGASEEAFLCGLTQK